MDNNEANHTALVERIRATLANHDERHDEELKTLDEVERLLKLADDEIIRRVEQIMHEHALRRLRVANAVAELHRRISILPIPGPEPRDSGIQIYADAADNTDRIPLPKLVKKFDEFEEVSDV